ncbi:P-loop containing nucleoside triphosphate hydrolase protein [Dactylonectria macrodidyma]|uniref:P-loop containing nucleoside triphosphate hydrolase protein n=1 Tax=Dactylonectria macrodidyma TaxID=307937 RepID=A0A9P9EES6_9HYPO|nr:P-loop containing nucleoside triphosphate hydrolase protein [Dactylonectria macrodidyma]
MAEAEKAVPAVEEKKSSSEQAAGGETDAQPEKKGFLSSVKGFFVYFQLLFAAQPTWIDIGLIICGTLSAAAAGVPFPLMGVLFGQLVDNFNSATCAADTATVDPFQYEKTINDKVIKTAWIGAIALVLIYCHLTCWNIISQRLAQRLRTRYVEALLRQPPAFFDTRGASGQVSSRLHGDITAVQAGTSEKVGNIITTISFFITVFVIAFSQQPRLAGILLCMLPAFLISGILGGKYLGKFFEKQNKEAALASSIASEALEHVAVVQAFGAAPRLEAKFAEHMASAKKFATKKAAIAALQTGMLYFIAYSGNALAFWQGSLRIADAAERDDGSATVGQIYAIVYLLVDACVMLGGIAPTLPFLGGATAAYQRLMEDITAPSDIDGTSDKGKVLESSTAKSIAFRNVSFEYASRPGQPVLQNVDLEFPAGKYTAIVGLSGSGKSTIAALIARLHDPTEGVVELEGHDMRELNVRSARSFISFVQQEPSLLDRSILENIALGLVNSPKASHQHLKPLLSSPELVKLAAKGKDALSSAASLGPELAEIANLIQHAAEQADAASFIDRLEAGYGTSAGPSGSLVSGGQRQRIALARAMIRDPEILVLDEATAALDSASEKRIQLAVERAAAEQRTIISIAHRLSTIRNADNIVVMQAGRVVEQGTYADLMAREDGEFARMAKLQSVGNAHGAEAGSVSGDSFDASTLKTDVHLSEKAEVSETKQAAEGEAVTEKKEEPKDQELDAVKPFSTVFKGLAWLLRPSLGWCAIALIAAIFVGATFSGAGTIFGFAVGALNPCQSSVDRIRSMGRLFSGLYFMLAAVELIANFLAWLGFGIVAERLLYNLRVLSFRSLLEQGVHWHSSEGRTPSTLLAVITKDSMSVGAFSGSTFGTVFAICINVLIAIIISHIFAWKIALVCLVTVPILLGSGFMQLRMLARYEERHREAFSTATSLATEAIQSIKTVATLSLEREYMESFERLLKPPRKQVVRASASTNVWLAISYSTGTFVNALAYWWGSQLVMKGEFTQTDFLIILVAMLTSAQLWSGMFALAPEFSRARLALSRVMTVVDMGSSTHAGKPGTDPSKAAIDPEASGEAKVGSTEDNKRRGGSKLSFKDVSFAYPNRSDVTILDNVSFTLPPNQFCGLVGPSGAGKSTIMTLVQRLYEPTSGSVLIDDRDISKLPTSFRDTIAIVPQEPALFDGSVRFNVGLGALPGHEATDAEIEEACRLANIHDVIAELPEGYDTECGPSASRLSGGQRQRLAIARALVRRPRLLLLDESTSALDAASEAALQQGLERASRGTTVLAITHRLHTVQKADVIFVVEGGQIVDSGRHAELMERRESYRLNAMQQMLQ